MIKKKVIVHVCWKTSQNLATMCIYLQFEIPSDICIPSGGTFSGG